MKILVRYAVDYRVNSTLTPSHDERICSLYYISADVWYSNNVVELC
jgi:hypothetical protein